ncbi:sugar transferase [Colwellia sp. MB3u-70]|uniref:sugar transferase n=1 Tax=unclassified Colwellia TaxID=196834 RepID=UPI0015F55EC5|nr:MULTISPECIES: sugar transferase [unclassified Colwellia]MBA6291514.1 sugar transferase [Colwellia sp. MB3u-8]MBA6308964.1 sugar transferase [Colwellia sp. MB3u-70]
MHKRIFDLIFSISTLLVLMPLFCICTFLIKVESKGPLFYRQRRLGKNGSIFEILKFRSMTDEEREHNVQTLGNEAEVTKVGKVIRRLKIDELPQLLNVVKGDMSIVGPRPCLPDLIDSFNEDGRSRLLVRPGLTGLAQINGNIHLTWEERWKYDREYIENMSFILDIKIILNTVAIVFLGEQWGMKK